MTNNTYFAEEITTFINCCIEDMASSYRNYADDICKKHGARKAQEWYRAYLDAEKDRGFGALQVSYIFYKVIDEDTFNALDSKLAEAYYFWSEESWEIKEAE